MIADLKPYPAMKDSGVEWLGEVPAHWEVRRLRRTLRAVAERNRSDLPLLSVVREKGVVLRDVSNKDENHNFIPDDLTNYKVVQQGQFAMNKMKAWQGSYGMSKFDGIVSPAYFVFNLAIASRRRLLPYGDQIQGLRPLLHTGLRRSPHWAVGLVTSKNARDHFFSVPPRPNKPPSSATSTTPTGASSATSAPSRS